MSEKITLKVEIKDEIAIIQFDRPEIKNPLSVETLKSLVETFDKLNSNQTIKTIIFTGSGNTFAAGANLREVAGLNEVTAVGFGLRGQNLIRKIFRTKKQTIAVIEGFCMGGALDLALSCQMRIASPDSFFAHPGAKLGIITGWGGTQILPRLIGQKKALEMLLTAKRINADEALQIGLIDKIAVNPLAKTIKMISK